MYRTLFVLVAIGVCLATPHTSLALPPPDLIVNIGSQFAQIFALLAVLFSSAAGTILQMSRRGFSRLKGKGVWVGLIALTVVVLALTSTWVILEVYQDRVLRAYESEVAAGIDAGIEIHDTTPDPVPSEDGFFVEHASLPIMIGNEEFAALTFTEPYVLDAREDEEYDLGHYPDSHHTRFADLIAGDWDGLPKGEVVYVFCWSGIRGKELTEFLRAKGIVARYLEDGAKGWVDFGGAWEGEILFSTMYNDARYTSTLSTTQVHEAVEAGAVLIDARQEEVFIADHIPGSLNITIFFTPSDELAKLFAAVPAGSRVITICDDYVSCFDAKIAGVKLEKLGHTFLGRYNKPWDY